MTTSGIVSAAAGVPLAQASGAELDRARQASTLQERAQAAENEADRAAGIGELDAGKETAEDRDADNRHMWHVATQDLNTDEPAASADVVITGRDDTSGQVIDLTG